MFFIACESGANSVSWKGAIPADRNSPKQVAETASITSEGFFCAFMVYRLDSGICNAIIIAHKQGRHAVNITGQFPKISKTSISPVPTQRQSHLFILQNFGGAGYETKITV
jgi:hypothetical protein